MNQYVILFHVKIFEFEAYNISEINKFVHKKYKKNGVAHLAYDKWRARVNRDIKPHMYLLRHKMCHVSHNIPRLYIPGKKAFGCCMKIVRLLFNVLVVMNV